MSRYADELWDKPEQVFEKTVSANKETLKSFAGFVSERCKAEEHYAQALQKVIKDLVNWNEFGTTRQSFLQFRAQTEQMSKSQFDAVNAMQSQVITPLHAMREEKKQLARKHVSDGQKLIKELTASRAAHDKLKQRYVNKCMEAEQAENEAKAMGQDPNTPPKQLSQVANKVKKLLAEEEKLTREYKDSVIRNNTLQETYDRKIADVLNSLEQVDLDRLAATKRLLQKAIEIQRQNMTLFMQSLDDTARLVEGIDPESDIMTFCAENRTGRERDPPLEFEQYIRRDGSGAGGQ